MVEGRRQQSALTKIGSIIALTGLLVLTGCPGSSSSSTPPAGPESGIGALITLPTPSNGTPRGLKEAAIVTLDNVLTQDISSKAKKKIEKPSTALVVHEGEPVEAEEIKKPETLTVKIGFKANLGKIFEEGIKTVLRKKGLLKTPELEEHKQKKLTQ